MPSLRMARAPIRPDTAWKVLEVRPTCTIGLGPARPRRRHGWRLQARRGDRARLPARLGTKGRGLADGQRVVAGEQPAPVVGVPQLVEARLVGPVLVLALGREQDRGVVVRRSSGHGLHRGHQPQGADGARDGENDARTGREHDHPWAESGGGRSTDASMDRGDVDHKRAGPRPSTRPTSPPGPGGGAWSWGAAVCMSGDHPRAGLRALRGAVLRHAAVPGVARLRLRQGRGRAVPSPRRRTAA